MMNTRLLLILFVTGMLLLVIPDALVFYLIMPVTGSQQSDQIELGHFLYQLLWYTRIIGFVCTVPLLLRVLRSGSMKKKLGYSILLALGLLVVYLLGYRYMPQQVFKEPKALVFTTADKNTVPQNNLVMGIVLNGQAKAYPLKFVGYHHKIQDSVGGIPVLITYCTMCRSGMVYDPVINGRKQQFRLVGAAFENAVIEDSATKSWWYQSTGVAGAGPLKGSSLKTYPFEQMSLSAWIREHPETQIMQPDKNFVQEYAKLKNYDLKVPNANTNAALNQHFSPNSWVIGVAVEDSSRAFLWNELTGKKVINTMLNAQPLCIAIEPDGYSFHAFKSNIGDTVLTFKITNDGILTDDLTGSQWNWKGNCTSGALIGHKLPSVQVIQTYYHTWQRFYAKSNQQAVYSLHNNGFFNSSIDENAK